MKTITRTDPPKLKHKKPFNKKEFVRLANEVGKLAGVDVNNLKIRK